MIGRGTAAALLLLVVGVLGGYAAAYALDPDPATQGAPTPVVARSPRVPVDPAPHPGGLPGRARRWAPTCRCATGRLGNGGFRLTYPVPAAGRG